MAGRILVTFAVYAEFAPWRRLRRFRQVPLENLCAYQTRIGNSEVLVILIGVGARETEAVRTLAIHYRPRLGIVAGVAAGLKPKFRPGDILVAQSVWNTSQTESVQSDSMLLECAVQCGAKPVQRVLSLPRIVRNAEAKCVLAQAGEAAEMESLPVMQCLSHEGVASVCVRVIADGAEEDVPCDFEVTLDSRGHVRLWRVILQMIIHPWTLASTVRFGLTTHRATVSFARYLDGFVERLAAQEINSVRH